MTDAASEIARLQAENAELRAKVRFPLWPCCLHPDAMYSTDEAATAIGVSKRTIDLWSRQPDGPKVTRLRPNHPRKYRGIDLLTALTRAQED